MTPMKSDLRKQVRWLIACVVVIAISALMVYGIERDFGRVDIQTVRIMDPSNVVLVGKLYRPVAASPERKLPAVLNLHGYQNDKEVNSPFSIELARRGFVVLALDGFGHGDSQGSYDRAALLAPGSRYTVGTNTGYQYLKSLPFVDAANLASMGHSLGAINSLRIGLLNPEHRALNFVAGFAGAPVLKNVLLTQARFEEFPFFREGQLRTEQLDSHPNRMKAFGSETPVAWDTTNGDFATGTARRATLINMDHHLLPLTNKAVAEVADWMRLALKGGQTDDLWVEPTSQIFWWKELFGLVTLVVTYFSLIPLTGILLNTAYFRSVAQPMPTQRWKGPTTRQWWAFATVNALIGGILYPPLTSIAGLTDVLGVFIPFLRLPMGNGLLLWFLVNALICAVLMWFWFRTTGSKARVTLADFGAAATRGLLGRTLLLGVLLFAWMYVLVAISQWALGVEFRFAWPYMRTFSGPERFGYFLIYLVPALAFFLINGGIFLYGLIRQPESRSSSRTLWVWWIKAVYAGLAGLALVWAVQYVPWFFFGAGPGFEELGLPQYTALWPLMLIVYIPEFATLLFMLTWFYRRTGRIYLGALMVSALAMWFVSAGSVISTW